MREGGEGPIAAGHGPDTGDAPGRIRLIARGAAIAGGDARLDRASNRTLDREIEYQQSMKSRLLSLFVESN